LDVVALRKIHCRAALTRRGKSGHVIARGRIDIGRPTAFAAEGGAVRAIKAWPKLSPRHPIATLLASTPQLLRHSALGRGKPVRCA